jgi:nickel/cobalt transporter (NicO) family protein
VIRRAVRAVLVAAAGALPLVATAPASAHPLGNFTVNSAAAITVLPGAVRIDYALDLAEIPTVQELPAIDTDGDDLAEPTELDAWARDRAVALAAALSVEVQGSPVPLAVGAVAAALRPGQGGLEVLRLDAAFEGPLPRSGAMVLRDGNDEGRVGWREITAVGAEGVAVRGSSVPSASASDHLRRYPEDLLTSPPSVREASLRFGPGEQGGSSGPGGSAADTAARPGDALGALVTHPEPSVPLWLVAVPMAFAVGALHALAPGHGKTIAAGYLAASGGGMRPALRVGAAVALMHTAAVLALGLAILGVQRAFPAEQVYPWLGVGAGGAAIALGAALLRSRLRATRGDGHGHGHAFELLSKRGLVALALSGGLLPSPSAVVVFLGAAALGRMVFGLALIAAFGVGLAAGLAGVGVLAVRALDSIGRRVPTRLASAIPIGGAAAVLAMGGLVLGRSIVGLV